MAYLVRLVRAIETTIVTKQLWHSCAVAGHDDGRFPKRVMLGRLAARGLKGADRRPKHWGDRLKEKLQLLSG